MSALHIGTASESDLQNMTAIFNAAAQRPDLIPQPFLAYMVDYLATANLVIPVSQVQGLSQLQAQPALVVTATETTAATAYGDLATPGPLLSAIGPGNYVVFLQATMSISLSADEAFMSVSVNGSTPNDVDGIVSANVGAGTFFGFSTQQLTQDSNTVEAKYRVNGGTGTFSQRKMVILKYANL